MAPDFQVSVGVGMTGSAKGDRTSPGAASIGAARKTESEPGLDRMIQAQIGDKLRSMYGELAEQPIPDRLTQILSRLGQETKA